jgi:hypothetical protein
MTTTIDHSELTGGVIDVTTDWLAALRERAIEHVDRLSAGTPSAELLEEAYGALLDIEREFGAFIDAMLRIGEGGRERAARNVLDDQLLAVLGELTGAGALVDALAAHDAEGVR